MTHNDLLRSLRYILNVSDTKIVEILELGGYLAFLDEVVSYLRHEDESDFRMCPDEVMAYFLDGLIIHKRGRDETRPLQPIEVPITNNDALKKLRVAFSLKDTDLIRLIEKSGTVKVTKSELGAFFRHREHRNYRECGDQYLRQLLKALG